MIIYVQLSEFGRPVHDIILMFLKILFLFIYAAVGVEICQEVKRFTPGEPRLL